LAVFKTAISGFPMFASNGMLRLTFLNENIEFVANSNCSVLSVPNSDFSCALEGSNNYTITIKPSPNSEDIPGPLFLEIFYHAKSKSTTSI